MAERGALSLRHTPLIGNPLQVNTMAPAAAPEITGVATESPTTRARRAVDHYPSLHYEANGGGLG